MDRIPAAHSLRGKFSHVPVDSGYVLYVAEFSNGVIKVGRTQRARTRLSSVVTHARRLFDGVFLTNVHITQPCKHKPLCVGGEYRIKLEMRNRYERVAGTTEFFQGATFTDAVVIAEEALKEMLRIRRRLDRLRKAA